MNTFMRAATRFRSMGWEHKPGSAPEFVIQLAGVNTLAATDLLQ